MPKGLRKKTILRVQNLKGKPPKPQATRLAHSPMFLPKVREHTIFLIVTRYLLLRKAGVANHDLR